MLKTRKRWISLLVTLAMLVTFCVPFVGSASAGTAATYNTVTAVPTFDPDDGLTGDTATVQAKIDPSIIGTSHVDVEVLDSEGKQLDITDVVYGSANDATFSFARVNDKRYTLTMTVTNADDAKAWINFALRIDARDCAAGDIKMNFFNSDGQLVDGSVVVATATGGAVTLAMVGTPPSIGSDSGAKQVTLRLNAQTNNAMDGGTTGLRAIKIKLPAGFEWTAAGTGCSVDANDARVLWIAEQAAKGIYDLTASIVVADTDKAKYGDVVASVEGQNSTDVSPSSLTVATYADYGVDISVDSVKTLLAGKYDQKTDVITIKEKIAGTLINGRKITVKFPDGVKVEDLDSLDPDYCNVTPSTIDGESNKFTLSISNATTSNKAKIEFKAVLNIEAGYSGDLEATVSGAGIPESSLTVAKVVAPVTAEATATNVKIGVQDQAAPDITITESIAGAAAYTYNEWDDTNDATDPQDGGEIVITLPDGAHFSGTPEATVTSGDLDIKDAKVEDVNSTDDALVIPIKSESLTASTIKITGIKLTLDRTVPEGPLTVKVGGNAVVENYGDHEYEFNTSAVAKFTLANCVTPADTTTTGTAVFKIGEAKYTLNGAEITMDTAPYIKDGRTMVPIRFAANAVGVADSNIIWDAASKKVTVIKGDRVVQMTIGSNVMLINGAAITMDTAPEINNDRTMLPVRFLGQALGADFVWDEATQTVTVKF